MHVTFPLRAVVASVAVALCSCQDVTEGRAQSDAAVKRFHEQLNAGEAGAIWDGAHDSFRQAVSRERNGELMAAILRKLGKVTGSTGNGWQLNSHNLTTTVRLQQSTTFERGSATESFVFRMEGGKAVLVGYNIQSLDLIIR
jgi:lysophospholipid acyltransferase (LPLAT)-like uncharacterized protein